METTDARRQALLQALAQAAKGGPDGQPTTLLLLDLDHFRDVNERYGHETGDRVLEAIAAIAQRQLGPGEQLLRCGGDEYAVIVPGGDLPAAQKKAVALGQAIVDDSFLADKGVTVTQGLAASRPQELPASLIARAEQAMRTAKEQGRNSIRPAN